MSASATFIGTAGELVAKESFSSREINLFVSSKSSTFDVASVVNFREDVNGDREQTDRVSLALILSVEITNHRIGEVVMISQGVIFNGAVARTPQAGGGSGGPVPSWPGAGMGVGIFMCR